MKNLLLLISCAVTFCANAQTTDETPPRGVALTNGPVINFEQVMINLGEIPKNVPVNTDFSFTNTGNEPLILSAVSASCSCSVAEWPKEPIPPGAKGTIKVTYNASANGVFEKYFMVRSNSGEGQVKLSLKGAVIQ